MIISICEVLLMSVFINRQFAIVFSGQLVSTVGNNLFMIALPWYVYSITGSKADLAFTGLFQTIPGFVGLFIGVFIDRWRKKQTLLVTNMLRGMISFALYVVVQFHPPLMMILILVLLLELIGTFYRPASSSFLPLILPKEKIPSAMGFVQSGGAFAQLFGVLLGGTLIVLIGAPLLFLLNGITFVLSFISLLFVRVKEVIHTPPKKESFAHQWLDGIRTILHIGLLLRITLAIMVGNCVIAPLDLIMTAWVKGPMHGNAFQLGTINAAFFIGILVGGVLLGRINKRMDLKTILLVGMVISGVAISLIGLFPNMYWAIPFEFIFGYAYGSLNGCIGALAIQTIPEQMRGRLFATLGALSTLIVPLGMALYGWFLVIIPIHWIYLLIGIPAILSGLSFLIPLKEKPSAKIAN